MKEEREVHGRYVNILTDAGFKAVFGDRRNADLLREFLNVVLPGGRKVESLEFSTTEIPGFTPEHRSIRLDLRCRDKDGTTFIVEMQKYRQIDLFKRCVSYAAKAYDAQMVLEKGSYDIHPVYLVGILADDFYHTGSGWEDTHVSNYTFLERRTHELLCETISITFVELKRFGKPLDSCDSLLDKWCYVLKHVGNLDGRPDGLGQRVFERFFEACEIARFDGDKKLSYEREMITERDWRAIKECAREDGRAEGMEEGMAKGAMEAKMQIALKLLEMGMPVSDISDATGLDLEQVEGMRKSAE